MATHSGSPHLAGNLLLVSATLAGEGSNMLADEFVKDHGDVRNEAVANLVLDAVLATKRDKVQTPISVFPSLGKCPAG